MPLSNILQSGRSGMAASKTAMATSGHNIANSKTEGFSRQRIIQNPETERSTYANRNVIGSGTNIARVERINDEYLEKQIRSGGKGLSHFEEKDVALKQVEDIFNEMNGFGLNRLISRFFNEFRKLSNEPDSEAIRQSVREASQALVNDFHRLRSEVVEVQRHIDSRIEGYAREMNSLADEVRQLNQRIIEIQVTGGSPNDLLDQRDQALKKLNTFLDISTHKDNQGNLSVDIRGLGPLVSGPNAERFDVLRSPADQQGKQEGSLDLISSSAAGGVVTHQIRGGKMGALLEVRDHTLSTVLERLDNLAFGMIQSINQFHEVGFDRQGRSGVLYFQPIQSRERAAEFIRLSDDVLSSVNHIASAATPNAPGDNRIALAIADLQSHRLMEDGKVTLDDYYNSIISDVGVASAKNRSALTQQRDIQTQLGKMRETISGVSIDEETANLLQYQHIFGASAKVIQVWDELLKTILDLKR